MIFSFRLTSEFTPGNKGGDFELPFDRTLTAPPGVHK